MLSSSLSIFSAVPAFSAAAPPQIWIHSAFMGGVIPALHVPGVELQRKDIDLRLKSLPVPEDIRMRFIFKPSAAPVPAPALAGRHRYRRTRRRRSCCRSRSRSRRFSRWRHRWRWRSRRSRSTLCTLTAVRFFASLVVGTALICFDVAQAATLSATMLTPATPSVSPSRVAPIACGCPTRICHRTKEVGCCGSSCASAPRRSPVRALYSTAHPSTSTGLF